MDDLKVLSEMVNILAISGKEKALSTYITQLICSMDTSDRLNITQDKHNNVTAVLPGTSQETVMLDAHLDQIGFVLSSITKEGMLVCYRIGGVSLAAVEAREMVVLTKNGPVPCVTDRKHMHFIEEEKDELPKKTFNIVFDIGCKTKEEAEALVEVGDYIGYKPTFGKLANNRVFGTALDDKIGCIIVLKVLEFFLETKQTPTKTLIFSFSGQEETGITRLKPLIRKFQPNKLLEFDVTFATDYDRVDEKEAGPCNLGDGLVVYVGNLSDVNMKERLFQHAKELGLKLQKQVINGAGGYNSDAVYELGMDVTVIGIPLRNMHSPVEICSMDDIDSGVKIITKLFY